VVSFGGDIVLRITHYACATNMRSDMQKTLLETIGSLSECGYSAGIGFRGLEPAFVTATYARPWVDNYVEKLYIQQDPTIKFGLSRTGHITWDKLERAYPDSSDFFSDARGFGLVHGNTLSIRAVGQISILSCSGPAWDAGEVKRASASLHALAVLHAFPDTGKAIELTDRVKDVLRLMCGGAKDQEISELLNVKIETVRARRRAAFQATETSTIAQLISEVIKNGLI
jgi:LuxR family transcriptional regulator, quorum-sensing system regulator SdiA